MSATYLDVKLSGFTLRTTDYREFASNAVLVPIGKSGSSRGGAALEQRWDCRDNYEQPNALGALHEFVGHCLTYYEAVSGEKLSKVEANEFVGSSVGRLLDPRITQCDPLYYAIGPDNRILILYRYDSGPLAAHSRESILAGVWLCEGADKRGA